MSHPDLNSQCALRADSSLKDVSEITFYHDPDDTIPLQTASSSTELNSSQSSRDVYSVLLQAGSKPAQLMAGSRRSVRTTKPSARLRDTDNACGPSSFGTRKRALSNATDPPVPKKVATHWQSLSSLDSGSDGESEHTPTPVDPDESDEH
jgi:hypothetical protein